MQIHESKLKLDASSEIIQKLDNEVSSSQDAIVDIVQIFEKKKIDKSSYPQTLLYDVRINY